MVSGYEQNWWSKISLDCPFKFFKFLPSKNPIPHQPAYSFHIFTGHLFPLLDYLLYLSFQIHIISFFFLSLLSLLLLAFLLSFFQFSLCPMHPFLYNFPTTIFPASLPPLSTNIVTRLHFLIFSFTPITASPHILRSGGLSTAQ